MDTKKLQATEKKQTFMKALRTLHSLNKSKEKMDYKLEDLPKVAEMMPQLLNLGKNLPYPVVLTFPLGEIDFTANPQCRIKKLAVTVSSTESQDMALLHKLHAGVRDLA